MRLRDWLNREERHRRKAEQARRRGRHDTLSPAEAAEVFEMSELVHQIRTGEFPLIEAVIAPEPIGPAQPTVDDEYALFAKDPLTAPLPGRPARDQALFAEVLNSSELHPSLVDDLNTTRSWDAGYLAKLARGER